MKDATKRHIKATSDLCQMSFSFLLQSSSSSIFTIPCSLGEWTSWATTMGSLPLGYHCGLVVDGASRTLYSRNEVKVFIYLVPSLPGPVGGSCTFTKGHNSYQDIYKSRCCSHQSAALSLRVFNATHPLLLFPQSFCLNVLSVSCQDPDQIRLSLWKWQQPFFSTTTVKASPWVQIQI